MTREAKTHRPSVRSAHELETARQEPTATALQPFAVVRVCKLLLPTASYDGWKENRRPPAVGDTGTVIDVLHASGLPARYVVECVGHDGMTEWISELLADELEAIDADEP